jgi:hypothetical protein
VAWTARWLYGEHYQTVPMQFHETTTVASPLERELRYCWTHKRQPYELCVRGGGPSHLAAAGSLEEFVIEHYWAYTQRGPRTTLEYRVDHPRWRLWTADGATFTGDIGLLYGSRFVAALSASPVSAFLADGSPVAVQRGTYVDLAAPSPDAATAARPAAKREAARTR